jgi:hypothetical protein
MVPVAGYAGIISGILKVVTLDTGHVAFSYGMLEGMTLAAGH